MTSIAVVGDLIVDRDVVGHVGRVAGDAPVPIVEQPEERIRPGGAGLAAALAAAGADVALVTAASDADTDRLAVERLRAMGVTVHAARRVSPVPQKIRVRTEDHVMLRVDRGVRTSTAAAFPIAALEELDRRDAILVSDYGGEVARTIDHDLLRPRQCLEGPHELRRAVPGELSERQRLHNRKQVVCTVTDLVSEDFRPPLQVLALADVDDGCKRARTTAKNDRLESNFHRQQRPVLRYRV